MHDRSFSISLLTRKLTELADGRPVPTHRKIYELVLDGDIPARQVNGRWRIEPADLPAIAEKLCPGASKDAA